MRSLTVMFTCVGLFGAAHQARAQAQIVPTDEVKGADQKDINGWAPFLGLTSTINLTSNSHVVGQVDGFSTLFGLGLAGGADYVHGKHLLRSTLSIDESFARTPVIDEFIKTNDVVKLEGLYNYFVTKNLGGFGRLGLSTSAFPAEDVRAVSTMWVEKTTTGTNPLNTGFRQRLAGSFAPFTINESVGAFAEPIHGAKLNLSVRVGLGARHTFADTVLLIDDDKATPMQVELLRLSNVHQLGAELFGGANGKFRDGKASYRAGLSVLFPFVNNDKDNRTVSALTRVGFEGALTFNIYSWMSLVYSLNITRDAQLFPKGNELTQVQNSLLLTFQFNVVKKKEKDKEPSAEEKALAEEKKKAAEAEQRAIELQKQLEELKANPPPVTPPPAPAPAPAPAPTPAPTP